MMVSPMQKMSLRVRGLLDDRSGLAAIEFAMIFPMIVAMVFMTPYAPSPLVSSITQAYVDKTTGVARVQWSRGLTIDTTGKVAIAPSAPHNPGDVVVLPTSLVVAKGTYVIWSKVSYKYTPAVGYMLAKTGITFNDAAFTRPRSEVCVIYPTGGYATCQEL